MNPGPIHSKKDEIDSLAGVLTELRRLSISGYNDDEKSKSLREFLLKFHELDGSATENKIIIETILPDAPLLTQFFDSFGPKYKELQSAGEFVDFWAVAMPGRDEISMHRRSRGF